MKFSFATVLLIASIFLPPLAYTSTTSDTDAIRRTIHDYFNGIRQSNRKLLTDAFAIDVAHMKGYVKGKDGKMQLTVRPIKEVIEEWSKRKPRLDLKGRILTINVQNPLAAQATFDFDGTYVDSFQLAKINGRWKIINKFYYDAKL